MRNDRDKSPTKEVSLITTGTNWTPVVAIGVPYQTISGRWRIKLNIIGNLSSSSADWNLTIQGITFSENPASERHCLAVYTTAADWFKARANSNSGVINLVGGTAATGFSIMGDVPLNEAPDWA